MPIRKINTWLEKLESYFLVTLLLSMIGIGFAQIVLRSFDRGIAWADVVIRHLFFTLGFVGAVLAVKEGNHLCMDLLCRFLHGRFKRSIDVLLNLISCVVTAVLAKFTYDYALVEKTMESFLLEKIPSHWPYLIIPIGFAMLSLRFLIKATLDLSLVIRKEKI